MKDIKTRSAIKNIRTLDRDVNVAERMKNAYVRSKEQAEQTQQPNADSPSGYAEDRVTENAQHLACRTVNEIRSKGKRLAVRNRHSKAKLSNASSPSPEPHSSGNNSPGYTESRHNLARSSVRQNVKHISSDNSGRDARQVIKATERGMKVTVNASKKTVKTSEKGSIKSAYRSVKTVEQTSRAAIKTTQATAKAAAKTAQVTAKAAQRAVQAARATVKAAVTTAKTIAKAVAVTVKALVVAIKGLSAAIAAGGWIAVIIIIVVLLFAYILSSVFGIFASEEGYNGAPSMPEVVSQINAEFSAKIDSIIDANPHDTLVIDNAGSASMVANWDEVLAIYAILVATEPENPIEVATLDDSKIEKLKTVFWDMNHVSYSVNVVEVGTGEESEEPITETVLTIKVSYRTAEEMVIHYGFNTERAAQVLELLQPEYDELFMRLTGSYVDITLSAAEIAAIMETQPDNLREAREEVVLTAYSLLGKVNYFWGGKSLVLGWDSRWGTPMKVIADDNPTAGKVRPFGLDCSGFVDWVFYNVSGGDYIIGHGGGAEAQYSYCDATSWNDAQPGDLAFYPDCEHVGIVVMSDSGTLTVIHCASGSNNVVMTQHTQGNGFTFVGRPQIFY